MTESAEWSRQLQTFILELLFPQRCLVCGRFGSRFCESCQKLACLQENQFCAVCALPSLNGATHEKCVSRNTLDGLLVAGEFTQLQPLIHAYKYDLIAELARHLVCLCLKFIREDKLQPFLSKFTLCPVPLHPARLRFRGFNQSALLAEMLAERLSCAYEPKLLIRSKDTTPQTSLDRTHREDNIRGAFETNKEAGISDKQVLLIDDIATTGATLNECARILKRAGAESVWGLVLARG